MRPRGNHIPVGGVLFVMLAVVVALAVYFIRDNRKNGVFDPEDSPIYTRTPDATIENIGARRSAQKEAQVRQYNEQLMRQYDLRTIK